MTKQKEKLTNYRVRTSVSNKVQAKDILTFLKYLNNDGDGWCGAICYRPKEGKDKEYVRVGYVMFHEDDVRLARAAKDIIYKTGVIVDYV